jgi:hypothetical protein
MNHSNNADGHGSAEHIDQAKRTPRMPWLILTLPLVMVGLILLFSPNFKITDRVRTAPLGGDFLQEWVGAKVFEMGEEQQLYDLKYVQAVQHDLALVGFEWPEEDYFPMVYPPFYYASLQSLSSFSYPVASRIWAVLSALALSISGLLLYWFYPPCRRVFGVCFVAALIFVPLLNCFNMGQKSTFLLLILSGTFVLLHNKRPFLAGVVFGLIIFKPHFGIVIGLTMLLKGQWKFAFGALAVVSLAFGYSWLYHGLLVSDYVRVISEMSDYVQTGGYRLSDSHSLWGTAQLTFGWLQPVIVKTIAAVLSLVVIGLLWRVMQGRIETDSPRFTRQFAAMVFAMVLLSPHFYGYDLTILLLPMLLIVSSYAPGTWRLNVLDLSLGIVLLGIFVFAGLFAQIAGVTSVQPSIFLMAAALTLLGLSLAGGARRLPDFND